MTRNITSPPPFESTPAPPLAHVSVCTTATSGRARQKRNAGQAGDAGQKRKSRRKARQVDALAANVGTAEKLESLRTRRLLNQDLHSGDIHIQHAASNGETDEFEYDVRAPIGDLG